MSAFSECYRPLMIFFCHDLLECYSCSFCNYKSNEKIDLNNHNCGFYDVLDKARFKVKRCHCCKVRSFSLGWHYFHRQRCNFDKDSALEVDKKDENCLITKLEEKAKTNAYLTTFERDQRMYSNKYAAYIKKQVNLRHPPTLEAWFRCDHCEFKTLCKSLLKKHLPCGLRQTFQCDQCDYTTIYKRNIKPHKTRKHLSKEFQQTFYCHQCTYISNYKNNLATHIKRKHGLRQLQQKFQCVQCDYGTAYKQVMKKHKLKHLLNEPQPKLQCNQCKYSTIDKSNLLRHQKAKHFSSNQQKF